MASPFFRLPPELRDRIYSYLFRPTPVKLSSRCRLDYNRHLLVHGAAQTLYCTISRAFGAEYRQQAQRYLTLEIDARQSVEDFKDCVALTKGHLDLADVRRMVIRYNSKYGEPGK